jgi:hypothetical protein
MGRIWIVWKLMNCVKYSWAILEEMYQGYLHRSDQQHARNHKRITLIPDIYTMPIHGILPYPQHARQHESNIHSSNHPWNL